MNSMTIKAIRQTGGETIWEVDGLPYEPATSTMNYGDLSEDLIELLARYTDCVTDSQGNVVAIYHYKPTELDTKENSSE